MVATSVLSTDAEMVAMAGENVDATGFTDDNKTAWGKQAEAYLNGLARYDFVTNVAEINTITIKLLSEYVARYVAIAAIAFNMSGFTSRIEAENMINIHLARMEKVEKLVREQKVETFLKK